MTVAEETKSEAMTATMTADQTTGIIGISAVRAMAIEIKTVPNNNRVRVVIEIIQTVDLGKDSKDLVDHNSNKVQDHLKKIVDLDRDRDLADQDPNKDHQEINKIVGHNKDQEDQDLSLILDKQMLQRMILHHQKIRLRSQKSKYAYIIKRLSQKGQPLFI